MTTNNELVYDFLKENGKAYSYEFSWRNTRIEGGIFSSSEACDDALGRALLSIGYTEPRWFEFWRWGEQKPPEGALRVFRKGQA